MDEAFGGRRVARALIDGSVRFAHEYGVLTVENYPVDNRGIEVDATMAFVGTRALFESAGFSKIARSRPQDLRYRRSDGNSLEFLHCYRDP
ncbi:hypothetical protein [Nonomuraea sp. NPDC049784]|uniref:hypothetical protein n=1 Tax=Nonomuraea sp. NPDC049784 TaxID=3154361 RepID=UPI0033D03E2B